MVKDITCLHNTQLGLQSLNLPILLAPPEHWRLLANISRGEIGLDNCRLSMFGSNSARNSGYLMVSASASDSSYRIRLRIRQDTICQIGIYRSIFRIVLDGSSQIVSDT